MILIGEQTVPNLRSIPSSQIGALQNGRKSDEEGEGVQAAALEGLSLWSLADPKIKKVRNKKGPTYGRWRRFFI